jgi:F-type H+-transporting ATPase subunit delta
VFKPSVWAQAFIADCTASAGDGTPLDHAREALECLKTYVHCALSLPGYLSGKGDAERLDSRLQKALEASGFAGEKTGAGGPARGSPSETSRRFLFLMIRRGCFRYCRTIIVEIEKIINRSRGLITVILESAFAPGEALTGSIKKKILEQSDFRDVELTTHINPNLVGGLRLRIGSILFDASIKTQLQRMAADLGRT